MKRECLYQPPFQGDKNYFVGISDSSFMNHKHMETEIMYCLEGTAKILLNNEYHILEKGDLFIINPLENHNVENLDDTKILFVEMGEAFLGKEFSFFSENSFPVRKYRPDVELDGLIRQIVPLSNGQEEESVTSKWKLQALLFLLASKLTEIVSEREPAQKLKNERSKASDRLDKLLLYINRNYMNEISLKTAEQIAGYEQKYLCRIFKEATGMTIHKYINACRIEAARLLIDKGVSLSETRAKVGLPDERTFIRLFVSFNGQTPSEYKNRKKKNKTTKIG